MDLIEELLESVCAELEACGHPELVAEVKALLAKIETLEDMREPVEEEDEVPYEPEDEE